MQKIFIILGIVTLILQSLSIADAALLGRQPPKNGYIYTNKQYGISVYLSSAWKGYTVKVESRSGASEPIAYISFSLPSISDSKSTMIDAFYIAVLKGTQWKSTSQISQKYPLIGNLIGKNKKYTFTFRHTDDPGGLSDDVLTYLRKLRDGKNIRGFIKFF